MKKYLFKQELGIWLASDTQPFNYSDGDEVETRLLQTIQQANDVSLYSDELYAAMKDWPSEYHLSRNRHNLLRPFSFTSKETILELGCGCGSITRLLGETGAKVIAVEGSQRRAQIAAARCRDLENVSVYCDNIADFALDQKFDYVLLIGVLEYSRMFIQADNAPLECLKIARQYLMENGSLFLAIENQLGLKYFNGAGDNHLETPFFGIQGLYDNKSPVTFGKNELAELLIETGFNSTEFYYPFPDYKIPKLVLSEQALSNRHFNVADLLLKLMSRDYTGNTYRAFNENLVWQTLAKNSLVADFANSFLIKASCSQLAQTTDNECKWLAKYYNVDRKKELCTELSFEQAEQDNIVVKRYRLLKGGQPKIELGELSHVVVDESYITGNVFIKNITKLVARQASIEDISLAFKPWLDLLKSKSPDLTSLPANYIDCIPSNLLYSSNQILEYYDAEWVAQSAIPFHWVAVRGIFDALHHTCRYSTFYKMTYLDAVKLILSHNAISLTQEYIDLIVAWENKLQRFCQPDSCSINSFEQSLSATIGTFIPVYQHIVELQKQLKNSMAYRVKQHVKTVLRPLYRFTKSIGLLPKPIAKAK